MSTEDRSRASRSRPRLAVEGLERRELLSFYGTMYRVHPLPRPVAANVGPAQAGTVSAADAGDLGPPTPNELAKARFVAKLAGTFETAPGRFQKQPLQGIILSSGGSTQALRLQSQMQFFMYGDPSIPNNGQVNLSPKNNGNTGNILLLDLTADPSAPLSHGLVTRYNWTVNGSSGGLWQGATGSGTLDVTFQLTGPSRGIRAKGKSTLVFQGQVFTNHGLSLNTMLPGNRGNIN